MNGSEASNVKAFWAIDFDRCIGSVDTLYGLFEEIIGEKTAVVNIADLEITRQKLEVAGGSFDMLSYIQQALRDETLYQDIIQEFLARAAQKHETLLEPGVHELFEFLRRQKIPHGIVSYGHYEWQSLKIAAVGYGTMPYLILDHSKKGEVIAGWQTTAGFQIPVALGGANLMSQSVVLVDDKAVSFTGLPDKARGYWVRPETLLSFQEGSVPPSVTIVDTLLTIVTIEEPTGY